MADSSPAQDAEFKHRLLLKSPHNNNNNNKRKRKAPGEKDDDDSQRIKNSTQNNDSMSAGGTQSKNVPLNLSRNKEFMSRSKEQPDDGVVTQDNPQKKGTSIVVNHKIQSQPRPSPPFPGHVRVVSGRYQGLSGFLSPTGTYGHSVLSTDDGQRVTVNDNDVVDASDAQSSAEKSKRQQQQQEHKEEDPNTEIHDFFLECLKKYVTNDAIEEQKGQVSQLRSKNDATGGDEMAQLHQDLLKNQENKLKQMYEEHHYFQLASNAFGVQSTDSKQTTSPAN